MAKSGSNLVHSYPSHVLCLTPCVKAIQSFHGVLPCLVMMYHHTNLGCNSFNISEDLVETIVTLTLNIEQNGISAWYSSWWWCITIQNLINQRYCPGKNISWSSEPSPYKIWSIRDIVQGKTLAEVQNHYHTKFDQSEILSLEGKTLADVQNHHHTKFDQSEILSREKH